MKSNSFFSREHDYALRIVAFLASIKKDQFVTTNQLAQKLFISKNFAARIVHKLKNAQITGSVQGKYGGVYLKVKPEELSIWDVVVIIGFKNRLNDCMKENFYCDLQFGCRFHLFFLEQENILIDKLKSQKISDYLFQNLN